MGKRKDQKQPKDERRIFSKLSLIENSYSFLNQSLRHYRKSSRNVHEWPFAILHITQSIELMLKHVLRTVHPILIFEDIDNPKRTVTLERALTRLTSAGISISDKEKVNILRASTQRNNVVHYEFELNRFECRKIYSQLFEFVHFFHAKHLNTEIHARIAKEHWSVEARLMSFFQENFVTYNGVEMFKENPADIVRNQGITYFEIDGKRFDRIVYGSEPGWMKYNPNFGDFPCHDCGVVKGQYHADRCDVEECPKHHGQLLGCGCG